MITILIVEDDDTLRDALATTLELAQYKVLTAVDGKSALNQLRDNHVELVVSDVRMDGMDGEQLLKELHVVEPALPVILITAHGTIHQAVEAMRYGAVDYILKPFESDVLLEKIQQHVLDEETEDESTPVSKDPKSQAIIALADKVAASEATVLISGESGTGKEVLARYIHDHSPRKDHMFVAINCAAIPEQMLEATLFGYEKGAFTGAMKAMPGKFEQANGGTLLLDEISEMDLQLQAKLLRVLQEKEVERLGSTKTISLDVRIIATTNRMMLEEIEQNRFREDLYYRLNVFPLHWRPLRERQQDIMPMAEYFVNRHWNTEAGPRPIFSEEAISELENYDWPGNAREMDNVIQRGLILHTGSIIQLSDLQLLSDDQTAVIAIEPQQTPDPIVPKVVKAEEKQNSLTEHRQKHEFDLIGEVLKECESNRKQASEKLGVSERTLRYKLAKMREQGYKV